MLSAQDLFITFNPGTPIETRALRGMSLDIPAGQFVTVIGSNGAGKSTFLNAISGDLGVDTGRIAIALEWQRQLLSELTHPTDLPGWYTDHQRVSRDILVDDCARTDEGELADGDAAHDGAVGTQRGAALDQGVAVFVFAFDERARVVDVGEHHARAAEHALFQGDVVVHRDVVLHLALVADDDLVADEDVLAQGHALADAGAGADVGEVPHA